MSAVIGSLADHRTYARRRPESLLVLDDLETEDLHAHAPALVVLVPTGGPRRTPALVVLAPVPPRHHEVAVLPDQRAQQLEALEALRGVNASLPCGEALLDLGLGALGEGQCGDVDIGHRCSPQCLRQLPAGSRHREERYRLTAVADYRHWASRGAEPPRDRMAAG